MQNHLSSISFNLRESLWKNEALRLEVKERKNGYGWDKEKLETVEKKLSGISNTILVLSELFGEVEEIIVDAEEPRAEIGCQRSEVSKYEITPDGRNNEERKDV